MTLTDRVTDLTDLHRQAIDARLILPPAPQEPAQSATPAEFEAYFQDVDDWLGRLRTMQAEERRVIDLMDRFTEQAGTRLRAAWPELSDDQHQGLLTLVSRHHRAEQPDLRAIGRAYDDAARAWTTTDDAALPAPVALDEWHETLFQATRPRPGDAVPRPAVPVTPNASPETRRAALRRAADLTASLNGSTTPAGRAHAAYHALLGTLHLAVPDTRPGQLRALLRVSLPATVDALRDSEDTLCDLRMLLSAFVDVSRWEDLDLPPPRWHDTPL